MKVIFAIILTALSLSLTALASSAAHAETQPNKVAVIDIQR